MPEVIAHLPGSPGVANQPAGLKVVALGGFAEVVAVHECTDSLSVSVGHNDFRVLIAPLN